MERTISHLVALVFVLFLSLAPRAASAATVLVVSDGTSDLSIATVLTGDGHTVTTVMNDGTAPVSVLLGDLSMYDMIVWSGTTGFRSAATFTNLTNYVTAGGRVFYTGYSSTLGDTALWTFLGCTGAYDFPSAPGPIAMLDTPLTTGMFDIRGITPAGYYTDRDGITGLRPGTVSISADTDLFRGGHEWTLRTLGDGFIAWVSNGTFSGSWASWTATTGAAGVRVYNQAVRNFAFNAGGFSGDCTGAEGSACTGLSGGAGICHTSRCCVGCWDGTRCFSGTSGTACGVSGATCISCSDAMPCTRDVCTAGVCSNPDAMSGSTCEDGEYCTVGETCDAAGTCAGGRANTCDDMSSCTSDACNETMDRCDHTPGGSGCAIAGACYGAFTVNPSNRCQVCNPTMSNIAWSPRTVGTPCGSASCSGGPGSALLNDGGRCDASGSCGAPTTAPCPQGLCSTSTTCSSTCTPGSCPDGRTCNSGSMTCLPPAGLGSLCAVDADCVSGSCSDGVCCNEACDQLCDSCDLSGSIGTCMPTPLGGSCGAPICSGDSLTRPGTCDDTGTCNRPAPSRCPQGWCSDGATCSENCTADSCAPGEICTSEFLCVTPSPDGTACISNEGCFSGFCIDGFCCNNGCDEICEACNQPGREGRCVPYLAGVDPELDCPADAVCSGGHGCMAAPDAGPVAPDGGSFDAGPVVEPPRRENCSCSAAGLPDSNGALALLGGMIALVVARRRR